MIGGSRRVEGQGERRVGVRGGGGAIGGLGREESRGERRVGVRGRSG